jgi:hypothetical protein
MTGDGRPIAKCVSANFERFFAAIQSSNPFIDNRVNGPAHAGVDVDDIQRTRFEQLVSLARQARDLRRGLGAVLWGEAGIGKSHLLSRVVRWAEHDDQACAIYLHNLQASPENLPRSLLKSVVGILTRGQASGFQATPLYALVLAFVKEALHHDTTVRHPWSAVERAYGRLIDRLSGEDSSRAAPIDRAVYEVLYRFFRSAYRAPKTGDERLAALAVRWLAGEYIDPEDARQLGLQGRGQETPIALADNQQFKQVLVALCRMALSGEKPFLLCFDQVDNLDDEQASALSRFLEALIDSAPNLFVVTAGIQATLLGWRETKVIQDSAWDRLAQFQVSLQRLSVTEGRRIVAARLRKWLLPFAHLDQVRARQQEDDLFPLGSAWANEFFGDKIDLRPRDVINGAREGWWREQELLEQQGGPAWLAAWGNRSPTSFKSRDVELTPQQIHAAIDGRIAQKIAECCAPRRLQPQTLPPDADNLAGLIAGLATRLGELEVAFPPAGEPSRQFPYNLVVSPKTGKAARAPIGLRVLGDSSAASTTAALRWLTRANRLAQRTLLVTDARRPLQFSSQPASKGRQYYEELAQRDRGLFRHMELTFDQYAYLDALQAVIGMARSGDLEIELPGSTTRRVTEQEAIESHRRQGRYRTAAVIGELLNEAPLALSGPTLS